MQRDERQKSEQRRERVLELDVLVEEDRAVNGRARMRLPEVNGLQHGSPGVCAIDVDEEGAQRADATARGEDGHNAVPTEPAPDAIEHDVGHDPDRGADYGEDAVTALHDTVRRGRRWGRRWHLGHEVTGRLAERGSVDSHRAAGSGGQ